MTEETVKTFNLSLVLLELYQGRCSYMLRPQHSAYP